MTMIYTVRWTDGTPCYDSVTEGVFSTLDGARIRSSRVRHGTLDDLISVNTD